MSEPPSADLLHDTPYKVIGTPLVPQAQWHRDADGSWRVLGPQAQWGADDTAGPLAWRALSARAQDTTPMLCQRAADGSWRTLSWAQAWSQSRALASALLR